MNRATVDNVFIRAKINGKWESVSLREAVEAGEGLKAIQHCVFWLMGLREGEKVSIEHIEKAMDLLALREQHEASQTEGEIK